jgi:hypothetical protein
MTDIVVVLIPPVQNRTGYSRQQRQVKSRRTDAKKTGAKGPDSPQAGPVIVTLSNPDLRRNAPDRGDHQE